jgi:hypothetical protein
MKTIKEIAESLPDDAVAQLFSACNASALLR